MCHHLLNLGYVNGCKHVSLLAEFWGLFVYAFVFEVKHSIQTYTLEVRNYVVNEEWMLRRDLIA